MSLLAQSPGRLAAEPEEEAAPFLGEKARDPRAEGPGRAQTLQNLYSALFFVSIVNVFYDVLRVVRLTRVELLPHACYPAARTAVFLDVCLSAGTLLVCGYALRLLRDPARSVRTPTDEIHTYFAGYLVFWLGVKTVMMLLSARPEGCVFSNLLELPVSFLPRGRVPALLLLCAAQAAGLVALWLFLAVEVLDRKRRMEEILLAHC